MKKILLIEDDSNLAQSLLVHIKNDGHEIITASTLKEAYDNDLTKFDLIILDWMLPDGQGIDFLKYFRQQQFVTPVIMLTARIDLIDKIVGLETGANDYITKPFEIRELIVRIRTHLRTMDQLSQSGRPNDKSGQLSKHQILMDLNSFVVSYQGKELELTKMEFNLLRLLLENPGRAFSREELLNKVWGYENYPTTRTVDTHILQLRQKTDETLIETVRGIGYRLKK